MGRKQSIFSIIAVLCLLLFSISSSFAAWQQIANLGGPVGCCFFEDDKIGFAGSGTYNQSVKLQIWNTNNGGASWNTSVVPNGNGQVTQIAILPNGVGYASIFSQANPAMNLWKTTDNGFSWVDVSSGNRFGTCVNGQGTATYWLPGLPAGANSNGIFSSPTTQVITPGPNPVSGSAEAWSAYWDPVFKVWYLVAELRYQGELKISTDNGNTWNDRFNFGTNPTGHITGSGGVLYVQTESKGMYRTNANDSGLTWVSIGGPSNFLDTRTIYVGGCFGELIIAFDKTGGVWKSTDGGNGIVGGQPLSFTHPTFKNISTCSSDVRTIEFTNLYCYDYVVTTVSFDINTNGAFSLQQLPTLPDTLQTNEVDSFHVLFNPALKPGSYTAHVRIKGYHLTNSGKKSLDSVIVLTVNANPESPKFVIAPTKINFDTVSICAPARDTFFTMSNTGCDTLTIGSGPGTLIPEFTIDPLALPFRLPPDSTITLHCRFKPTTPGAKQDFPSYQATQQGLAKTIGMIFDGFGEDGSGILHFQPASFRFDTLSICSSADSSQGFLTNAGCIPLTIENFTLTGDPEFTLLGANPNGTSIKPGDTIRFAFKLTPNQKGDRTAGIAIRSKNTSGTGSSKDYSISLSGFIRNGKKLLSAVPSSIDFGTTTPCEERDSVITFSNKGCDTLIITAADMAGKGFTSMTSLPIILLPGENVKIPIKTIIDTSGGVKTMNGSLTITSTADNTLSPITFTRTVTVPSKKTIDFGIVSKPLTAPTIGTAGDVVSFALKESASLPLTGTGVKSLEFDLVYNTDLLEYINRQQGANSLTSTDGKHFKLQGNPFITGDVNRELADMLFQVFLTKDSSTTLTIVNVTLPDSGSQDPCSSSIKATTSGSSFTYTYICGEGMIQDVIGGKTIRITSIVPNPAHDDIEIHIISPIDAVGKIEIYDALGKSILQKSAELHSGKNNLKLHLDELREGSFTLRLRTESGVVSRQFVRVK